MLEVEYFGPRVHGPEIEVEDVVASHLPRLIRTNESPLWAAGSLPIGAGKPDIIALAFNPQVSILKEATAIQMQVLAYLRGVSKARSETIAARMDRPLDAVSGVLRDLVEVDIVEEVNNVYFMTEQWRIILPEIVAVEVKVKDWKDAVRQAIRNRVFSNYSFVAVPQVVADRIYDEDIFSKFGIGLLSINSQKNMEIYRRAQHNIPKVWSYYYQLAWLVAKHHS